MTMIGETMNECKGFSLHSDREVTYRLISRLFAKEIDGGLLSMMAEASFPECESSEGRGDGARLMNSYLKNVDERSVTELAVDFARLFVIRERDTKDAAYPYESVYRSEGHSTMGAQRDEVLALYRAAGLGKSAEWSVGEDHIALELEYMAVLSSKRARVDDGSDEAEKLERMMLLFLEEHLLRWVPLFAQAVRKHSRTDFYRGLSLYLEKVLSEDVLCLKGL